MPLSVNFLQSIDKTIYSFISLLHWFLAAPPVQGLSMPFSAFSTPRVKIIFCAGPNKKLFSIIWPKILSKPNWPGSWGPWALWSTAGFCRYSPKNMHNVTLSINYLDQLHEQWTKLCSPHHNVDVDQLHCHEHNCAHRPTKLSEKIPDGATKLNSGNIHIHLKF